jgi:hypothetical protein
MTGGVSRAERPTYALGDRWIRSDGIWEVIRVEPDHYVFSAEPGEIHLTKDLVLARLQLYGILVFDFAPAPQVPWPLVVGRTGSVIGKLTVFNHEAFDAELHWAIEAVEDVTVAAGTFKTFRIGYTSVPRVVTNFARQPQWARSERPTTKTFRLWYAPDIQRFVKGDGAFDRSAALRFEVIAVDPGDAAPLQVEVQEPRNLATIPPDAAPVVSGKASAGRGVRSVAVMVNGEIVFQESAKGEPRRTVVLNTPLPLRDGKNIILVTATDPSGTTSQEARTVFYTAPLAIRLPAPGQVLRVPSEHISLAVPVPRAADVTVNVVLNGVVVEYFRANSVRAPVYDVRMKLREGENDVSIHITE